jgi:hypothetical protein
MNGAVLAENPRDGCGQNGDPSDEAGEDFTIEQLEHYISGQ